MKVEQGVWCYQHHPQESQVLRLFPSEGLELQVTLFLNKFRGGGEEEKLNFNFDTQPCLKPKVQKKGK